MVTAYLHSLSIEPAMVDDFCKICKTLQLTAKLVTIKLNASPIKWNASHEWQFQTSSSFHNLGFITEEAESGSEQSLTLSLCVFFLFD